MTRQALVNAEPTTGKAEAGCFVMRPTIETRGYVILNADWVR